MFEPITRADLRDLKKYQVLGTAHVQSQIIIANILVTASIGHSNYVDEARPLEEDDLTENIILQLMDSLPDVIIYMLLNYRTNERHIVIDWS
jgi:hypothetical protein